MREIDTSLKSWVDAVDDSGCGVCDLKLHEALRTKQGGLLYCGGLGG